VVAGTRPRPSTLGASQGSSDVSTADERELRQHQSEKTRTVDEKTLSNILESSTGIESDLMTEVSSVPEIAKCLGVRKVRVVMDEEATLSNKQAAHKLLKANVR
jgi:hypothetical protein